MTILWLVNVKIPLIYKIEGKQNKTFVGGWLDQLSEMILQKEDNNLVVCYPTNIEMGERGEYGRLKYFGIFFNPNKLRRGTLKKDKYVKEMISILSETIPDIIHVHGTEFQYSLFMIEAAKKMHMEDKVVVSIQGMVKYYAEHFSAGIPLSVKYGRTVKELLLRNNISSGEKSYFNRGKSEEKVIKNIYRVIGRTNWDKGCVKLINPLSKYYHCNETLRSEFYTGQWKYENCIPHSIFFSQASYPIKGFHIFLRALHSVKENYPDLKVKVAGPDLSKSTFLKGTTYGLYVKKLIRKYSLEENIQFLGPQNANQIKDNMLKSNIFVSSSIIENSPNSLGEAMLLGVPCVSSDVGGVTNLLIHNEEGYIFPLDEIYMLSYYIEDLFSDKIKANNFGEKARIHARKTHNAQVNYEKLMSIYQEINENEKKE